jgi:hypothetical protein
MKKLLYIFLALALTLGLAACGSSGGSSDSSDFTWTREGVFSDEDGNYLMISPANDEEHKGQWAVTAMMGDEIHGWFLVQEGEALHGNLDTEYDDYEGDYIVTITEEGEDGVEMAVEDGDIYHFTMEETPEVIATMKINTEGVGQFAYAVEGEEVEFDEDFPTQSAVENLTEPRTYVIKAKPDEGWKFVKWTKDGKDFSTDEEITVDVDADVEYIAVFEFVE